MQPDTYCLTLIFFLCVLQTSPDLYPAKLSPETLALAEEAAKAAEEAWGTKAVPELEAEDRLSVASEKVKCVLPFFLLSERMDGEHVLPSRP